MESIFTLKPCSIDVDNTFGPYAGACRSGFDFTLLYEETILIIPLAILLIAVAPFRILYLAQKKKKVKGGALLISKLVLIALITVFQLVLIGLWSAKSSYKTQASIASGVLSFLAYIALGSLSYFEHVRAVRPSFTINCFLLLALLFDIAHIRTLCLIGQDKALYVVGSVAFSLKVLLCVAGSWEKKSLILTTNEVYPPEATSGSFNRWVFWWVNELMLLGYKKVVLMKDLFPVDRQMRSELLQERFQLEWGRANYTQKYALLWALIRTVKWPFLQGLFPRLCNIGFTFAQPLMINRAITLASSPADPMIKNQGYGMIGAYAIVYVGMAISGGQYAHKLNRMAVMLRGAMVSGIYSKTLDLSMKEASPAAAITLMSTDVEVIASSCSHLHETWANVVEIAVALFLLEQQLGAACVIPLILGIATVVATSGLAPKIGRTQVAWIAAIQERISTTTSILGAMKSIRLSGLTKRTFSILHNLRVEEIEASKRLRRVMIGVILLTFVNPVMTPILSFMVFALVAQSKRDATLLASKAFTALALFNFLISPLNALLSSIPSIATAIACCGRVQEYLLLESTTNCRILHSEHTISGKTPQSEDESQISSQILEKEVIVTEKKGSDLINSDDAFSVNGGSIGWSEHNPLLRDVSFAIPKNLITAIVGPVRCGKSTLLKGLLGELPFQYADLHSSSTRVAYCDQTPWLPNRTVQKVVLGMSSYDSRWYKTVLNACALEEDIGRWPEGDQSLVGSKGLTLSGGQKQRIALARAVYSRKDTLILDDILGGLDPETEDTVFNRLFGRDGIFRTQKRTVVFVSSTNRRLPYADYIIVIGEGTIMEQGTFAQLKDQDGHVGGLSLADATWESESNSGSSDDLSENYGSSIRRDSTTDSDYISAAEEANRRTSDLTVYKYYFAAVGWSVFAITIFLLSCFTVSSTIPEVWVNWWTAANSRNPNGRIGYYLGVYASFGIISILSLTTACAVLFLLIIPKCGVHFHSILSDTVANAPMSLFWSTDVGITLNRFSQDLQHVDTELPLAALLTAIAAFLCVAHLVLIGVTVKYVAVLFPFLIALFYILQKFYLRTSRQLRFLDLESKSSVYSQFTESLSGLITIRTFGWKAESQLESCGFLDESQKPYYLLFTIQRWLTITVDLMIAAMAVLLIALASQFRESISPGFLGIALLNVMSLNAALRLILTSWTWLETCIGSVLRIRTFATQTGSESKESENEQAPESWPSQGRVEFKDVSASYREGEDVLTNISLSIEPSQKIGICGRTGSGKSSFVLCLLRMIDMHSGSIVVDGVDLSTIPREDVRSVLAAVPQDPYNFHGTVRENADPSKTLDDSTVIDALIKCRVWNALAANGGLEGSLNDIALSNGQKQLFCFARGMLRNSKILVLDEAMSSVDAVTDAVMETLIRSEFQGRTVIAVSHKLESILDYDKVAILHQGKLVEFDTPDNLLSRNSALKRLYTHSRDEED